MHGDGARGGWGGARGAVEVVALAFVETQGSGEGAEQLARGMRGAALFEAHDVVDAHPGEQSELLAPQARRAATGAGRQPGILGPHPVAPGAQHLRELVHESMVPRSAAGCLVLPFPPSAGAWIDSAGGRRLKP